MIRATAVVFLILFAGPLSASELNNSLVSLENEWAATYYQASEAQQRQAYPQLLIKAADLVKRYPQAAEAKIWLATVMVSNAAVESSLTVLATLDSAKVLLEEAISQNPTALNGAAYLTLGTLYYMVPGWPVSFGDTQVAEQILKTSLQINPQGVDANYFYGDYLLRQERVAEAEVFFHKAVQVSVRKQQLLNDTQLQQQAKLALANIQNKKLAANGDKLHSLFAAATQISN
jgi:thioredoxin-like negative regulator of GroEL